MKKQITMKLIVLMLSLSLLSIGWLVPSTSATAIHNKSLSSNTQLEDKESKSTREQRQSSHLHKRMTKEQLQAHKLNKMKKLATYFGIETEGKSAKQLRAELEQAKKAQPEKWDMFKQQFRAKKLEEIREFAKSKGISIEGKTEEQLRDELHKLKQSIPK